MQPYRLFTKDRLGGLLVLVVSLVYGWLGQDIALLPSQREAAFNPRSLPDFLALAGIVLSTLLILFPRSHEAPQLRAISWTRLLAFLGLMSLYGVGIRPLGFIFATSLFLIGGFALLGERSFLKLTGAATVIAVVFWAIMDLGLGVFIDPLPAMLSSAAD